jgi:hypothetical protein
MEEPTAPILNIVDDDGNLYAHAWNVVYAVMLCPHDPRCPASSCKSRQGLCYNSLEGWSGEMPTGEVAHSLALLMKTCKLHWKSSGGSRTMPVISTRRVLTPSGTATWLATFWSM